MLQYSHYAVVKEAVGEGRQWRAHKNKVREPPGMSGAASAALSLTESSYGLRSGGNSLILQILLPPVHLLSIYLVFYT